MFIKSIHIPTSPIARPFIIYPKSDFWFENIPSGNPAALLQLLLTTPITLDSDARRRDDVGDDFLLISFEFRKRDTLTHCVHTYVAGFCVRRFGCFCCWFYKCLIAYNSDGCILLVPSCKYLLVDLL
jgi:hypothetical protein